MRAQTVSPLFERFLAEAPRRASRAPRDLLEYPDRFELVADLPGVAREDVEVHFEKGVIQVRAQARAEEEPAPGRYLRRERGSHGLEWSLRVGEAVDVEGIRAHLDAGVLRVSLPKSEHLRPREIPVRSN